MDFNELVKIRQSVRRYSAASVEPDKIESILQAAQLAPSACNSQPWHFIVCTDENIKNKVAKATFNEIISFNKFVLSAPVIIVIVLEKPKNITKIGAAIKNREFPLYDIGIVAEHICLQAAELGLGTCMLGWFNEKEIMKILSIPLNKRIGLVITLGYPEKNYPLRKKIRKNISEITSYNVYKS